MADDLSGMKGAGGTGVPPLVQIPSLEERVVDHLRRLIVTGELREGSRLRHRNLAKDLGVSPTPVRAGLSQLRQEGLVEFGRGGQAFVSRLTREALEEIYAARYGLEALGARLGAEAVTAEDLGEMERQLAEMKDLARPEDVEPYLELRWSFHAVAYEAAQRPRLVAEIERLYWRAQRYYRLLLTSPERFERSLKGYIDFLEACKAHSGARAEKAIRDSLAWTLGELCPALPSERALAARLGTDMNSSDGSGIDGKGG